jgi:hypothetical protein
MGLSGEDDRDDGRLFMKTLAWYKKFRRCKVSLLAILLELGTSILSFLAMMMPEQ